MKATKMQILRYSFLVAIFICFADRSSSEEPVGIAFDLTAVGMNSIKCPSTDDSNKPSKVIELHIPAIISTTFSTGSVRCTTGGSCVAAAGINTAGDDDDGKPDNPLPATTLNASRENWPTPLDVDLDPDDTGSGWMKSHPILVKIILDDPSYQFFRPNRPKLSKESTQAYWSHTVTQGNEGNGMFRCLKPPTTSAKDGKSSITLKIFESDTNYGHNDKYGGLNIGILVPVGGVGSGLIIPMYIDPQFHNRG